MFEVTVRRPWQISDGNQKTQCLGKWSRPLTTMIRWNPQQRVCECQNTTICIRLLTRPIALPEKDGLRPLITCTSFQWCKKTWIYWPLSLLPRNLHLPTLFAETISDVNRGETVLPPKYRWVSSPHRRPMCSTTIIFIIWMPMVLVCLKPHLSLLIRAMGFRSVPHRSEQISVSKAPDWL